MTAFTTPPTVIVGTLSDPATQWNAGVRDNITHLTEVQNWTPTLTQSVTVSKTVNYGRYWVAGKRVWAECKLTCTSAGTAANPIRLSLPVTAASAVTEMAIGSGMLYDAGTNYYAGVVLLQSTTTCGIRTNATVADLGATSSGSAAALAISDFVTVTICYEAA